MPPFHRYVLLLSMVVLGACTAKTVSNCPKDMQPIPGRGVEGATSYCQTKDGKRAQWIEFYAKTSHKRQSCGYAEGQPEGSFTAWHANGKPWVQGVYLRGKKARKWKQWDEAGSLVAEGEYRDGRLISGAPVGGMAGCEGAMK
jgi:hypothetical protein